MQAKGIFNVLDNTGHTQVIWDTKTSNTEIEDGPVSTEYAEQEFNRLIGEGHLAFNTDENNVSTQIKKFDPRVHTDVTFSPAFVGG